MSKVLKKVAIVAGAVALIATGVGAVAGAGALAATAATVASYASLAAGLASVGAQLTAKKPPVRGSVNNVLVQSDALQPCMIGETYAGGVLRHDVGYGATLNKVPNPYRGMVVVYSGCGPIEEIVSLQVDHNAVTFSSGNASGYFNNFLYTDTQLGATPESSALTPNFSGMTNWSTSHKLSGYAAVLWNLKFDRDGNKFAAGVPLFGLKGKGVKCYDPRLDTTYSGGSGSHRIDDETTWEYSENPALHAIAYAYGRHQNSKRVFGIGLSVDSIALEYFVSLANVCDTNGWKVGGVIWEPADKWNNLKEILQAGGAEPVFSNGQLYCRYHAPLVSLDTLTEEDLSGEGVSIPSAKPWPQRLNGIVPKYRSESHNYEYVPTDLVSIASAVTEDGLEKNEERQYNLVQDKDQASELAYYDVADLREIDPIVISCNPRLRAYKPGELLTINLPDEGLVNQPAVILTREIDPLTFNVRFTFRTETTTKHAAALASTGTEQPTPPTISTEDIDTATARLSNPQGFEESLIANSYVSGASGNPTSATDAGSDATISIAGHDRVYSDKTVTVNLGSVTGLTFSTLYAVYYDDADRAGGAVTYSATETAADAYNSPDNPDRHFVGYITTPADGDPDTDGDGAGPPGSGGGGPLP